MSTNKKKICFFVETLNPHSGWGRLAREIIERISKTNNYDITVLARENSSYPNEFPIPGSGFLGIIRSVKKVRRLMKKCDIIHAFDGWPNSITAYLSGVFLHKPLYITAVGTYSVLPLDRFWQGLLLRFAYRRAEKIFAISNYTKDEILKRVSLKNIEVVNLGVDFEKFNRAHVFPESKKHILLSVGEIKQRKGYHVALEAFFMLKKKFPELKYIIAGGGNDARTNYYRYLCEIIKKNGGGGDVIFTGDVSEEKLLELYGQVKVFVLPSVIVNEAFEGFGLVILEAFAAGVPAVGTKPSGMEDIIIDGVNGFLVRQNDSLELAKAIEKILSDNSLRFKLSDGALNRAKEMSWDRTIAKYKKFYEEG